MPEKIPVRNARHLSPDRRLLPPASPSDGTCRPAWRLVFIVIVIIDPICMLMYNVIVIDNVIHSVDFTPACEIRVEWKHNWKTLFSPAEILVEIRSKMNAAKIGINTRQFLQPTWTMSMYEEDGLTGNLGGLFSFPPRRLFSFPWNSLMPKFKLPKSSALSRVHSAWKWAKIVRA